MCNMKPIRERISTWIIVGFIVGMAEGVYDAVITNHSQTYEIHEVEAKCERLLERYGPTNV